jgi:hypothetical protein
LLTRENVIIAARLQTAEAPKEMTSFLEKQRELFQQQKRSQRDAMELLHQYRADDDFDAYAAEYSLTPADM